MKRFSIGFWPIEFTNNGATQDTTYLTGGGTINSLWTKKVLGFIPGWDDKGNVQTSYEGLASAIASVPDGPFICYVTAPMGMPDAELKDWVKGQVADLFEGLPPYESERIWCINEYAFAGLAAPVVSYILGSILGYDGFDIGKGMDMLQSFYDSFAPVELDADVGFVFTPDDRF